MDQSHYHQQYTTNQWPEWNIPNHQPEDRDNSNTYIPPMSSTSSMEGASYQQGQYTTEFQPSTAQPQHQYHHQSFYSSSMSLDNPTTYNDLSDAVSKLEIQHPSPIPTSGATTRRNLRLSMDIQPFISITEPTPVQSSQRHFLVDNSIPVPALPRPEHRRTDMAASPELTMVDEFIAQHMAQLDQQQQQQSFHQHHQQQHDSLTNSTVTTSTSNLHHDPKHDNLSFVKSELDSTTQDTDMLTLDHPSAHGPDWLSWTPNRGNSPVSSEFEFNMMDPPSAPTPSIGPYTSFTTDSISHSQIDTTKLNTGITTRPRRVSEPPRISNPLELFDPLDFGFDFTNGMDAPGSMNSRSPTLSTTMKVPMIKRSHSDRRNSRGSASFPCQHPGCSKSFTRHYNLTSHMRTHTAERPFACTTCQRRFARQHDRNRHEKLHWGIKPFSCGNCQKSFARMDALNRHLRVENGCGGVINSMAH